MVTRRFRLGGRHVERMCWSRRGVSWLKELGDMVLVFQGSRRRVTSRYQLRRSRVTSRLGDMVLLVRGRR